MAQGQGLAGQQQAGRAVSSHGSVAAAGRAGAAACRLHPPSRPPQRLTRQPLTRSPFAAPAPAPALLGSFLNRPYGRIDRPKLKRKLLERCVSAGVSSSRSSPARRRPSALQQQRRFTRPRLTQQRLARPRADRAPTRPPNVQPGYLSEW